MLQIYQSQKAEMSLVFQEQKKIQELIDRERQKELAIQAEITEIAQVLSQRIKHLQKMKLETLETTDSYQAMANSMIEKMD